MAVDRACWHIRPLEDTYNLWYSITDCTAKHQAECPPPPSLYLQSQPSALPARTPPADAFRLHPEWQQQHQHQYATFRPTTLSEASSNETSAILTPCGLGLPSSLQAPSNQMAVLRPVLCRSPSSRQDTIDTSIISKTAGHVLHPTAWTNERLFRPSCTRLL